MAINPKTGKPYGWNPGGSSITAPGTTTPGYYPDYYRLAYSDPTYGFTGISQNLSAQGVGDRAGLAAARKKGYIEFGEDFNPDPTLVGSDFAADIDPATRELALKNTAEGLSVKAKLEKQHQDNIRTLANALTARGALRSGETGYQLGQEEQAYKGAESEARSKVLDYFQGASAAYNQAERQRALDRAQALRDAMNAARQDPSQQPVAPTTTPGGTLRPTYMNGVYLNDQDEYVTADGRPWTPPAQNVPVPSASYDKPLLTADDIDEWLRFQGLR